ncbi:MAG: SAM-dependent methyltransferase [Lachnospiraceae bacterium]|nr:SAM-dependent methyltransferase [Lachnospiraceae bacterium]
MERQEVRELLGSFLNENLSQIVLSGQLEKEGPKKLCLRPFLSGGVLRFQAEEFRGKQVFHKNMEQAEAAEYVSGLLGVRFKQAQIEASDRSGVILAGKKGGFTGKVRKKAEKIRSSGLGNVSAHNRTKKYILKEGIPVPFLIDLGVMTSEGRIVHARYDKFRQINRFLEFIEDVLPQLDASRESVIVDFGCGKSYLTFAMYYYLKELRGYPVRIIGLDLKADVMERCEALARKYGYEGLTFLVGDIASYEGADQVDMVVTLHACDTATDYALEKAVSWNARVILSVPCCQHELNAQIESELLAPLLRYGIIKERVAALCTDALRAQLLEAVGYRVRILEFIDMEHTPKNLLIRAIRQGKPLDNEKEVKAVMEALHVEPSLYRLLFGGRAER